MSGPSLTKWEAHHAIHQAAFDETERLTRLLRQAVFAREYEAAFVLISELIEYWQTHTLQHAEAEETGWYREIVAGQPERLADVTMLTRDHELLRILLAEIQGILAVRGITSGIVERFEAMLLVNAIHSREEERRLLQAKETVSALSCADEVMVAGEMLSSLPQREPLAGISPLVVTHPTLYAQLMECLRARGLRPGDLRASVRQSGDGRFLHIVVGQVYRQEKAWSLPDEGDRTAIEELLSTVTQWCEEATKADYTTFMHMTP